MLLGAFSGAGAARAQDRLSIVPVLNEVGVSAPTAFRVQRQAAATASGAIVVTLSSSSPTAGFGSTIFSATPTMSLFLDAGVVLSQVVYFADGRPGPSALSLDAGPGVSGATIPLLVSVDALDDDFESATFNAWSQKRDLSPVRFEISDGGVHRGLWAAHLLDTEVTPGNGALDSSATLTLAVAPRSAELHVRFWLRVDATGATGSAVILGLSATSSTASPANLNSVYLQPGAQLQMGGHDTALNFQMNPNRPSLGVGAWHLIELEVVGLDTAAGVRRLYVDGVAAAEDTAVDFRGCVPTQVQFGEPWSDDRRFVTEFWADDLRVSLAAQASVLEATSAVTAIDLGQCVPVTVQLKSSAGSLANAPFDVASSLTVIGLAVFGDPQCRRQTSFANINKGASSALVYVSPVQPGTATLRPTHADFLSVAANWEVRVPSRDAGTPDPAGRTLLVGCGCGAGEALGSLAVAMAWLIARKRTALYRL